MHLSTLTLHGFKSFADKTAMPLEPGITVVVGPNGSGKSNVVDALTWVLGSHSAKSLRGGQMADVIFAGSPTRKGYGRAKVEITIDNAAGTLPVEFSEVRISRAMFADGETEYTLNGESCRHLDIAEMLSDTGLGREHHQIVGQGRLDAVLAARPEERRAFIEEAAGILKHRRRKERSVRKLSQTEAHLERLGDIVREVKRGLKPLERQAERARRHGEVRAELTEVRRALALRELHRLTTRLERGQGARDSAAAALSELDATLVDVRRREAAIEEAIAELTPALEQATATHFRLANLVERYRGLGGRIEERRRGLTEAVDDPGPARDPAALRAQAAAGRAAREEADEAVAASETALAEASAAREDAERRRRAYEQAAAAEARRRAEDRERQLRWEGRIAALRSSLAQAAHEQARLASQIDGLTARHAELTGDAAAVRGELAGLDEAAPATAERRTRAEGALSAALAAAEQAAGRERDLERQRASLEARAEALRAASTESSEGIAALAEAADRGAVSGVRGRIVEHVTLEAGSAKAVAAALGALGDALVADSPEAAADAVAFAGGQGLGRVLLLAAGLPAPPTRQRDDELAVEGARPLAHTVRAADEVAAALAAALDGVYLVEDYPAACRLAAATPGCTFVTSEGELAGALGYAGGSAAPSGAVVSRAAADAAEGDLEARASALVAAAEARESADAAVAAAREELAEATAQAQAADAAHKAAGERLARLEAEVAATAAELAAREGEAAELDETVAARTAEIEELDARGSQAAEPVEPDPGPDLEAERLEDVLRNAREAEVAARLEAAAALARRDELTRRIAELETAASDAEELEAARARRRAARLAGIERCAELSEAAGEGITRAERSLEAAAAERTRLETARAERQEQLGAVRAELRAAEQRLSSAREVRHQEDLARQELAHAVAAVRSRLADDLDVDADTALAEARRQGEDGPLATREDLDGQLDADERRLAAELARIGAVNPLAEQEHRELAERHAFLSAELADVRRSRADLEQIISAVDDRIRSVFAEAFADVAAAFADIFPRLFPGGSGRLVLTDPDDLLNTGVDVEARPPGKTVKRLSLLSGGERSLTALAILFAIFTARPSPFYVLDEVEVALDDVNLQRFLDLLGDFRATSQLIIVTHQKRTMEIADLVYGVTMESSGVSRVLSQRTNGQGPTEDRAPGEDRASAGDRAPGEDRASAGDRAPGEDRASAGERAAAEEQAVAGRQSAQGDHDEYTAALGEHP